MEKTTLPDPPADATERRAWIKYRLEVAGLTLGELSRREGATRTAAHA